MKNILINFGYFLWIPVVGLMLSCEDEDHARPGPSIFVEDGIVNEVEKIGETFVKTIRVSASAGLRSLEVTLDGATFDSRSYDAGTFIDDFELEYSIALDTNLVGNTLGFVLTATDLEDRNSRPFTLSLGIREKTFDVEEETPGGTAVKRLVAFGGDVARVDEDLTLDNGQPWVLDGPTVITNEATLTIEAGTIVYADNASFLAIQPGATIQAEGTAGEPIVFTSSEVLAGSGQEAAGDWEGLYILGNGQVNLTGNDLDLGAPGTFGGQEDEESSGRLSYVRVEYAGGGNADAAITLNAVGSGTRIDHIQSFNSGNGGIQIFGGMVNVRNAVVVGALDHSFNCRYGWRGFGQYWLVQAMANTEDPRALEVRNNDDAFDALPRTAPIITNITLVGPGEDTKNEDPEKDNKGTRIRQGASGQYHNFLVTQFPDDAIRLDNDADNGVVLTHGHSWNNDDNYAREAQTRFDDPDNNLFDTAVGSVDVNQWAGSTATAALETSTLGEWFHPASFIGAIESAENDWTAEGEWCKNEDGSIR